MNHKHFAETLLPSYTALQPFFRERMLPMQYNDDFICPSQGWSIVHWDDEKDTICDQCIILPHTIDDSSEEARKRSLVGMLTYQWALSNPCPAAGVDSYGLLLFDDQGKEEIAYYEGATPTEAIMKALCAQEGVEI